MDCIRQYPVFIVGTFCNSTTTNSHISQYVMKKKYTPISEHFGVNLATLLAEKISAVYPTFAQKEFIDHVAKQITQKSYTERVSIIAHALKKYLPKKYTQALTTITKILGPENPNETGMFKEYYWQIPLGKFIELFGVHEQDHVDASLNVIAEITKRNTGEYAIRPFALHYPQRILAFIKTLSLSKNFHERRLASEGIRPKLPWAKQLTLWNKNPKPIFDILHILRKDPSKFVRTSVANHVTDWIKIHPKKAGVLIAKWQKEIDKKPEDIEAQYTAWIIKRATRKYKV